MWLTNLVIRQVEEFEVDETANVLGELRDFVLGEVDAAEDPHHSHQLGRKLPTNHPTINYDSLRKLR